MPGDVPEPDSRLFRLIQIDEYRVSQAIAGELTPLAIQELCQHFEIFAHPAEPA